MSPPCEGCASVGVAATGSSVVPVLVRPLYAKEPFMTLCPPCAGLDMSVELIEPAEAARRARLAQLRSAMEQVILAKVRGTSLPQLPALGSIDVQWRPLSGEEIARLWAESQENDELPEVVPDVDSPEDLDAQAREGSA